MPGLFIVSVFLDLFVHPFTAGFFVAIAVAGGMNLFLATLIAASGSMLGGNLYYFMGKSNKRIINVTKYDKLWNKFSKAIYKNNLVFLLLFSATTGPFSIISFFSGNIKIPYYKYLLIAFIGRSIKFFFYALIGLGIFKLP
jgi:membrane protein YqaA with SNARE-associated domain